MFKKYFYNKYFWKIFLFLILKKYFKNILKIFYFLTQNFHRNSRFRFSSRFSKVFLHFNFKYRSNAWLPLWKWLCGAQNSWLLVGCPPGFMAAGILWDRKCHGWHRVSWLLAIYIRKSKKYFFLLFLIQIASSHDSGCQPWHFRSHKIPAAMKPGGQPTSSHKIRPPHRHL